MHRDRRDTIYEKMKMQTYCFPRNLPFVVLMFCANLATLGRYVVAINIALNISFNKRFPGTPTSGCPRKL